MQKRESKKACKKFEKCEKLIQKGRQNGAKITKIVEKWDAEVDRKFRSLSKVIQNRNYCAKVRFLAKCG